MAQCQATKAILIYGFIREIDNMDCIVPETVIEICFLFYSVSVQIFMHSSNLNNLYVIDIINKDIVKLAKNDCDDIDSNYDYEKYKIEAMCYIPNINGIFSVNQHIKTNDINASIISFQSKDKDKKYDLSIFNETKLNGNPDNLVYCGDNNIIYEYCGDLYQIQLAHIDKIPITNNCIQSIKINTDKENNNKFSNYYQEFRNYLSFSYLYKKNKIFGIICIHDDDDDDDWLLDDDESAEACNVADYEPSLIQKQTKFGIFDLNEYKWTYIDDYYYQILGYGDYGTSNDSNCFKVGICKYNYYDLDNVYTVSSYEEITKYNISKNKWITLINPDSRYSDEKSPNVWFDDNPNILYYQNRVEYGNQYFKYVDLRNNEKHSIEINNMHDHKQSVVFL